MTARSYAAPRPARRRVQRRVGPSRIRWDRIGRIALVLVLFGVLVSYLNPLVNLFDAWQGSKASQQHLTELKQENAQLKGQLRDASSPATLVREARRLGMVRVGEHAYVVHKLGN
jgi:cell division protein FtsB